MLKRKRSKIMFGSLLAILAFSAACKKSAPQAPAPPPPTPAAPSARPTVDLQASTTIIQRGETVTLTWSSTNATSLSLSPEIGNVPAEGTQKVTPQDSTSYTISATGPGGSADANVRITVSAPAPTTTRSAEPTVQQLFEREVKDAYFDYDKADVRADARDNLSQTAQFLRSYPQVKIVIEGHCDERGSTEYNLALGDRRAAAAKQFLASLGIPADRMETVSYGKERPFCTASDEACYTQNRRAHIIMAK